MELCHDPASTMRAVRELCEKATPGEGPKPEPSRFGTDHFIVENHPLPHIAAIKREEDACAAVAAVNFIRSDAFLAAIEQLEAVERAPVVNLLPRSGSFALDWIAMGDADNESQVNALVGQRVHLVATTDGGEAG